MFVLFVESFKRQIPLSSQVGTNINNWRASWKSKPWINTLSTHLTWNVEVNLKRFTLSAPYPTRMYPIPSIHPLIIYRSIWDGVFSHPICYLVVGWKLVHCPTQLTLIFMTNMKNTARKCARWNHPQPCLPSLAFPGPNFMRGVGGSFTLKYALLYMEKENTVTAQIKGIRWV